MTGRTESCERLSIPLRGRDPQDAARVAFALRDSVMIPVGSGLMLGLLTRRGKRQFSTDSHPWHFITWSPAAVTIHLSTGILASSRQEALNGFWRSFDRFRLQYMRLSTPAEHVWPAFLRYLGVQECREATGVEL